MPDQPHAENDSPIEADYNACPHCEAEVEVSSCSPFEKIACPHCGGAMRVRVQFDHYVIKKQLGVGGMSQVFEALDTTLNRRVALKILNRENSAESSRIQQFEREAKLTASVSNQNVVRVFGVGTANGNFYIAMELVEGYSLEERLHEKGKLQELRVLDLAVESVEGLRAASRVGLIHRDIKPGNILVSNEGHAKIVDFGLALIFEADNEEDEEMWATPYYVPPEKLSGDQEDLRSDLYSFGATLFHLLAGRPMYNTTSSSVDELRVIKQEEVKLGRVEPLTSVATQRIIDKLVMPSPDDRYSDYDSLFGDLEDAREQLRASLGAVNLNKGVGQQKIQKKKNTAMVVGLVAVTALVVGLVAMQAMKDADAAAQTPAPQPDTQEQSPAVGGGGFSARGNEQAGKLFVEAREKLIGGEFDAAAGEFEKLMNDSGTPQPLANWAGMNAAFAHYLQHDPGKARAVIAVMRTHPKFDDLLMSGDQREFFEVVSALVLEQWPVSTEMMVDRETSGMWGMAALLYGMKNWEHGRFELASEFINMVDVTNVESRYEWLRDYRGLLDDYVLDASKMKGLPIDEMGDVSSDVQITIDVLQRAHDALSMDGRAKRLLSDRLRRLKSVKVELEAEEKRLVEKAHRKQVDAEMERLAELEPKLEALGEGYQFREAAALCRSTKLLTAEAKVEMDVMNFLYHGCEEFIDLLIADLNDRSFRGSLKLNQKGAELRNVTVVKATSASLAVKRGGAVFTQPVEKIPSESLVQLAQWGLKGADGASARQDRLKALALFSVFIGDLEAADKAASEVSRVDNQFTNSWKSLRKRIDAAMPPEETEADDDAGDPLMGEGDASDIPAELLDDPF